MVYNANLSGCGVDLSLKSICLSKSEQDNCSTKHWPAYKCYKCYKKLGLKFGKLINAKMLQILQMQQIQSEESAGWIKFWQLLTNATLHYW